MITKSKISIIVFCSYFLLSCSADRNCIEGDCENGRGTLTSPDGDKYVGELKNGKYHGQGTFTFFDGRKYVGEYKDGELNGQGVMTYPDGRKWIIGEPVGE